MKSPREAACRHVARQQSALDGEPAALGSRSPAAPGRGPPHPLCVPASRPRQTGASSPRVIFTQFSTIFLPPDVMMLSGWNCTPWMWGYFLWRTPMMVPSSVQAVTSRSSGHLALSITSEWYRPASNGLRGGRGRRGQGGSGRWGSGSASDGRGLGSRVLCWAHRHILLQTQTYGWPQLTTYVLGHLHLQAVCCPAPNPALNSLFQALQDARVCVEHGGRLPVHHARRRPHHIAWGRAHGDVICQRASACAAVPTSNHCQCEAAAASVLASMGYALGYTTAWCRQCRGTR